MSHKHSRQMRSWGTVTSRIVPGVGLVFGDSARTAKIAATFALLRRDLRIGGKWRCREWDGGMC